MAFSYGPYGFRGAMPCECEHFRRELRGKALFPDREVIVRPIRLLELELKEAAVHFEPCAVAPDCDEGDDPSVHRFDRRNIILRQEMLLQQVVHAGLSALRHSRSPTMRLVALRMPAISTGFCMLRVR